MQKHKYFEPFNQEYVKHNIWLTYELTYQLYLSEQYSELLYQCLVVSMSILSTCIWDISV